MRPETSIRRRLSVYLGGGLLLFWLMSMLAAAAVSLHEIDEAADTQMAQLVRILMQAARRGGTFDSTDLEDLIGDDHGGAESDHQGFAVWDENGRLLASDPGGKAIPFQTASGFQNDRPLWQGGRWRYLYLHDEAGGRTVAVAQDQGERFAALAGSLGVHFALSLLSLPVLLLLLHYGIRKGLSPLTQLSDELRRRDALALHPVSERVPAETLAVVQSLNGVFARVEEAMARERRFTADAAHELRSPLAALKVQAEVLALGGDEEEQQHHFARMNESIARAQRLTEQLLVLSRIDSLQTAPDAETADWPQIARRALESVNVQAREKRVRLTLANPCGEEAVLPLQGSAVLLELMLRNLLDNAVRYSPENSRVSLILDNRRISVCDEGRGIAPEHLPRVRDRFYRPAGQAEQGSGLGLSIVERIAALHGLKLDLANRGEGGLCAALSYADGGTVGHCAAGKG